MGIFIIYHGYNDPVYNAHKNVSAPYTWQNTVSPQGHLLRPPSPNTAAPPSFAPHPLTLLGFLRSSLLALKGFCSLA